MAALFAAIAARWGRVDVLFNNAGVSGMGVRFEDINLDQWREVVDTNLTGSFLCAQAAFKMMKAQLPQGGRIINNGSLSAHAPRPQSASYTSRMAQGVLQANGQTEVEPMMDVREVADAVLHMAALPLSTNVQFMTIMATQMPFIGRG